MIWHILPHVSACIVSGQIILLDVRRDRYFAVPAGLAADVRTWLAGPDNYPAPHALTHLLQTTGISTPGDPALSAACSKGVTIPAAAPIPASSDMRLPAHDHVRIASVLVGTWLSLRLRPLREMLTRTGRRESLKAIEPDALATRAAAYAKARRFLPIPRNCLLDSLALDQWLGAGGAGRYLVLGVTAYPFAAHCWLQSDDLVLNDSYDRVSRYTPILVL